MSDFDMGAEARRVLCPACTQGVELKGEDSSEIPYHIVGKGISEIFDCPAISPTDDELALVERILAFGRRCREEVELDKKRLDWYEANPRKISICAAPLISFWVWDEVENRMYLRLREAIDDAIRVEERSR